MAPEGSQGTLGSNFRVEQFTAIFGLASDPWFFYDILVLSRTTSCRLHFSADSWWKFRHLLWRKCSRCGYSLIGEKKNQVVFCSECAMAQLYWLSCAVLIPSPGESHVLLYSGTIEDRPSRVYFIARKDAIFLCFYSSRFLPCVLRTFLLSLCSRKACYFSCESWTSTHGFFFSDDISIFQFSSLHSLLFISAGCILYVHFLLYWIPLFFALFLAIFFAPCARLCVWMERVNRDWITCLAALCSKAK